MTDGYLGWDEFFGYTGIGDCIHYEVVCFSLLLELGWVCFSCKAKFVNYLYVRNRFDQYYYFLYLFEKVRKEGRLSFVSSLNGKGDEFMRL